MLPHGHIGKKQVNEQECKMVNTRPNTQLKHHHRNCYGIVVPIKMQAEAYRPGVFNLFYEIAPFQKMLVRIAPHKNDYCTFI